MNTSSDSAEQVVRLTLEGIEVVARITGAGAKEALAMIYAVLKDNEHQSIGKTNLINMLRTCKNIKIFSMPKSELQKFVKESKKYGILYCTLLDKEDNSENAIVDIMVRGEDAARIDRIIERYHLDISDTASLRTGEKEIEKEGVKIEEKVESEKTSDDVINDILGSTEFKSEEVEKVETTREENGVSNTFLENENQLEPSLKNKGEVDNEKKSIRKTIQQIEKKMANKKKRDTKERGQKGKKRKKQRVKEVKKDARTK